jgi:hypothetical protein
MNKTTITLAGVLLAISTSASAQGVQCMPCPAGTYAAAGATECTPCPAGTYQPSIMASSCMTCARGTFSSAGASVCKECPSYTKGPISGGKGYFGNSSAYIYCKLNSNISCVLDSSQSSGGCYGVGWLGLIYNGCSDDSYLRESAGRFCKNGGSF